MKQIFKKCIFLGGGLPPIIFNLGRGRVPPPRRLRPWMGPSRQAALSRRRETTPSDCPVTPTNPIKPPKGPRVARRGGGLKHRIVCPPPMVAVSQLGADRRCPIPKCYVDALIRIYVVKMCVSTEKDAATLPHQSASLLPATRKK